MLDAIIRWSIHHKLMVGLLVAGLVAWGGYASVHLPIDAVPDITNNQVQIITTSPSLATLEVEQLITFPVEQALVGIPGLLELRSLSRFGLSIVTVVFSDGTDIYWARQQIQERLQQVQAEIPPDLGRPQLGPISTGLGEIYQYILRVDSLHSGQYSPMQLREIQDWIVRRGLLGTPGVADISSIGGYLKQYEVSCSPQRLASLGVSTHELLTALQANNRNTGGGYIERDAQTVFIRSEGMFRTKEDIEAVVIRQIDGIPLTVGQVATVRLGHALRFGGMTLNDEGEAVGGIVLMLKGANSSEVVKAVKLQVAEIQQRLPPGVRIEPFLDRTRLVEKAISTVASNLTEGALIVVFILVLLLGNLRAGLLVASVIPLSLLFALGMMHLAGVSGNLMSLGAIDFGLIVDGTVIIVEATLHHLGIHAARIRTREDREREVYVAASRIRSAAAFGEIIILIVYLPLLALTGVEGRMFRPMALTVAFAILGAFLLSLTYVPMMAAWTLRPHAHTRPTVADRIVAAIYRAYRPVRNWALRRQALVLSLSLLLFGGAVGLFSQLGGEFVPTLQEGDLAIQMQLPVGSSLPQVVAKTQEVAHHLRTHYPEVRDVVGKIGSSEIPTDPMPIEEVDIMVLLHEPETWRPGMTQPSLAADMAESLEAIEGVELEFSQPIQLRFNELMTGAKQDVALKIYGENLDTLAARSAQAARLVAAVPGVTDVYLEPLEGLPQLVITPLRDRLAAYGIPLADVQLALRAAYAGEAAGQVFEGERRFDLVVRYVPEARADPAAVGEMEITAPDGTRYPLRALCRVSLQHGPNQVQRDRGNRRVVIGFNVRGRDVESTVQDVRTVLAEQLPLPSGYFPTFGGQFQNLVQARARLSLAVPVALALIFSLLFFTFQSIRQSLLIFSAIPLAAVGGVLALAVRGMPFSISAGVGFIALSGVAVLNGIVLVAEFNHLQKAGIGNPYRRILSGTQTRLRPVVLTAAVASLGFLPMALATSAGAEVQRPLATVVIGGLVTATLLTLVVLPVLYLRFLPPAERRGLHPAGKAAAIMLLGGCLLGLPAAAHAQTDTLRLDQAEASLLENHPLLKAAEAELLAANAQERTAFQLPGTTVTWTHGQINSPAYDDNLTVEQRLLLPNVIRARKHLFRATTGAAIAEKELLAAELLLALRQAYASAAYYQGQYRLLAQQQALLGKAEGVTKRRFELGETNRLEVVRATAELSALTTRMQAAERNGLTARDTLRLFTSLEVPAVEPLQMYDQPAIGLDTINTHTPAVRLAQQRAQVLTLTSKNLRQMRWPELIVGGFNQSLAGVYGTTVLTRSDRQYGFVVGLQLPLGLTGLKAQAEASQHRATQAQLQADWTAQQAHQQQRLLRNRYAQLYAEWQAFRLYQLPQAAELRKVAILAYELGETDFNAMAASLQTALELELAYLHLLYRLTCTYHEYRFVTGQ